MSDTAEDQTDGEARREGPGSPSFLLCGPRRYARYGRRLAESLSTHGFTVASSYGKEPLTAKMIDEARALLLLRSPHPDEDTSEIVRRVQERGLPVFAILVGGLWNQERQWFHDGRDGRLPDAVAFRRLERFQKDAKTPLAGGDELPELRTFLDRGDLIVADQLTTRLLWTAFGGKPDHRKEAPAALLIGIDAAWIELTAGHHGFQAQLARYDGSADSERTRDFLRLAEALGWTRAGVEDYRSWAIRNGEAEGFFPTLRSEENDHRSDWYDRWASGVIVVHTQLRRIL